MINASNADHDDADDWLAIMNRQRIMVPERLRGKDNGTNMFLAVSYLRRLITLAAMSGSFLATLEINVGSAPIRICFPGVPFHRHRGACCFHRVVTFPCDEISKFPCSH